MHFSRLRLVGFKSFVDPTDLLIEPGLTGVVGPNGCGKSNLLEALRWIMGEASPTRVRGGGMEDVIFAGTSLRPSRNLAEVTLSLANPGRDGPPRWNDTDEIEVTRRIERGSGSAYVINGQDMRARDVRHFFADIASGTSSSALVNQGHIADIINRKPANRRHLLEEAAGIAGLQARRHEADLRLQGAERNLDQLVVVIENLEARHAGLRRQERMAQRYRNLAKRIRDAEMRWRLRLWQDAGEALVAAGEAFTAIESEVAELTGAVAAATSAREDAATAVPPARQALGDADRALHELDVARGVLEAEGGRIDAALREARTALGQLADDLEREQTLKTESHEALAALDAEREGLVNSSDGPRIAAAEEAARSALREVQEIETQVIEATRQAAALAAERHALAREIADCESRLASLDEDVRDDDGGAAIVAARTDLARRRHQEDEARQARESARRDLVRHEEAHVTARRVEEETRLALRGADQRVERLESAAEALEAQAWSHEQGDLKPLLDSVEVSAGYENALGAALGDDLEAPSGDGHERGWQLVATPSAPPGLPAGAEPLSRHVTGPPELTRRLERTWIVDALAGSELAAALGPGERLVSRDGDMWRWDGYYVTGSRSGAAIRLAQRARLEALRRDLEEARPDRQRAFEAHASAVETEAAARLGEDEARRTAARLGDRLAARVNEAAAAARTLVDLEERQERRAAEATRMEEERASLEETLARCRSDLSRLPEADDEAALEALRQRLDLLRQEYLERQRDCDRLHQERDHRLGRIEAINRERDSWRSRAIEARQRIADMEERIASRRATCEELESAPERIARQQRDLGDRIGAARERRKVDDDRLVTAETRLAEAERTLRQHEQALYARREERARREGALAQANQRSADVAGQIRHHLSLVPEDLADQVPDAGALAEAGELEQRYARAVRERDNMGPVNLTAGTEMTEIAEQIAAMERERSDLEKAIQRLRRGISELNREGRERLLAAFNDIDRHFQDLHRRLAGGEARLSLVDSDDPLEAGLEVDANPSGKKLQALSLLSGGEQAMAALALIFALFLTNPSPVCVLDEVDAPLDDANVARFCDLLDEFAATDSTRFLVITHHRVTMARMHRLFGVTMSEPGVSQLVSVDLDAAERLRDDATAA